MKWIKFRQFVSEKVFQDVSVQFNGANIERIKQIAYNGEYTIEDDGQPEPVAEPTEAERLEALEAAMLELMGVETDG